MRTSLRQHLPLTLLVAAYVAGAKSALAHFRISAPPIVLSTDGFQIFGMIVMLTLLVYLTLRIVLVLLRHRPVKPVRFLAADFVHVVATPRRVANIVPILLLIPAFMGSFGVFKALIPKFRPFTWDADFAAWDRAVHFGYDPWRILQPVMGHPMVSSAVNLLYHLWFFILFGTILSVAATTRDLTLRMRSLLTLMLIWPILGNLAGTVFSSAGPVYFGRVTNLPDPYVPLMDYLNAASKSVYMPALPIQDWLWQAYLHSDADLGSGISAMPSLHVATSFVFALIGFQYNRWLGWLLTAFFLCILLGSVHLGWHYAIDGYVGILGAWLTWVAMGWLLERPPVRKALAF